ncbi:MAG: hypothetical protein ACUBOA_08355 [Candidatus Loosdrechtia sp.]|uniref:hypothetical protein n=1 Tax=Candidatus Loosdrechtia sp. TaxID=3101272 RepID=UPI003A6D8F11|nr:MAG: hypothetical protein QY305_06125 [Candidatus Jettenia sp. AMX2]
MSTFEDLDDTITKAHDDGRYAQLATAIFQRTLEKRMHENLVSLIMTEEETRLFKNELQSKNN